MVRPNSLRLALAAAVLAVPGVPALAQASVHDTHLEASGAAAGRSPHRAYRPVVNAEPCGKPAMHSVPSGKGHVFGTHAFAAAPCASGRIAAADGGVTQARD